MLIALLAGEVVTTDQPGPVIEAMWSKHSSRLLVGVAGAEATKRLGRELRDQDVRLVQVPLIGDDNAEMALALEREGAACGLRLEATETELWDLAVYGSCGAVGSSGDTLVVEADELAEDAEPERAELTEAQLRGALIAYKNRRLVRDRVQTVNTTYLYAGNGAVLPMTSTDVSWTVFDGGGYPHSPRTFARLTGDRATLDRLERERIRARRLGIGFGVVGASLLVGTMATTEHIDTDIQMVGWALAAGGAAAATGAAIGVPGITSWKHKQIASCYTPRKVDRLIRAWNEELRIELGLSIEDVESLDLK